VRGDAFLPRHRITCAAQSTIWIDAAQAVRTVSALALALGADTYKLRFGHHGANVPVLAQHTGRVEITSQNHGFAVDAASVKRVGGIVTHINLNDDTLEGFVHRDLRVAAVQYHPEASPGPHDGSHVLARFVDAVSDHKLLDVGILA
jgi:carbamoyl-phosphate synthase small subunit